MSISSQNPLVLLLPVLTIYFTLRRAQQRASITDLSQQIQKLSKAVYSSITFKNQLNQRYLQSWLKIKKIQSTNSTFKDLQLVIQTIEKAQKRKQMKQSLINLGKAKFKTYQQERSMANGGKVDIIAPISATPMSVVNAGLEKLLKPTNTDVLIDLGCGDGRWLIAAAKKYGCRCIGIDIEEERLAIGRKQVIEMGVTDLVELNNGDIFATDLSQVTMVIAYLFGESTSKVRRKVLKSLKFGCLVLSVSFQFKDDGSGGDGEDGEGRLELIETLDEGIERKLLLYRWVKK